MAWREVLLRKRKGNEPAAGAGGEDEPAYGTRSAHYGKKRKQQAATVIQVRARLRVRPAGFWLPCKRHSREVQRGFGLTQVDVPATEPGSCMGGAVVEGLGRLHRAWWVLWWLQDGGKG